MNSVVDLAEEIGTAPSQQRQCPVFQTDDGPAFRKFYEREGFVVLRGLVAPNQCDRVMAWFDHEVRHTATPILRQKNMRYEVNRFSPDGFLTNPIFNVQDLQKSTFGGFTRAVFDTLTTAPVAAATSLLLGGERTKLIQSMFFEAPAGTWAHQDSYYQDSASGLGQAVAGWFALEDIAEEAGRFFVSPGSHRDGAVLRNEGKFNFAGGHEAYKRAIAEMLGRDRLPILAPALAKGDVLLWNSLTIHGSFAATRPGHSRRSLTAHYLRDDDEMLQFHARIRRQETIEWNGMRIGLLHDQDKRRNRLIRNIAYRFPGPYMTARKIALKAVLATRKLRRRE